MNVCYLICRAGKDAESFAGGKVSSFSIALDNGYSKDGAWVEKKPSWYDVKFFNKIAEKAANVKKGDLVMIEGRLTHEEWESDGQTKTKPVIIGRRVAWISRNKDGVSQSTAESDPWA